jgi:uracil-DNA glycosylase family 4
MQQIEKDIQNCSLCGSLEKLNFNTIKKGKNTKFLFVGESPSKKGWLKTGNAFYDEKNNLLPTGKVLDKLLKLINLSIDDITFTEMCKCYIPERSMLLNSCKNCLPFLFRQINKLNSEIVVLLGEKPTKALLNNIFNFKNFSEIVGKTFEITNNNKIIKVIPIYHTSPINPLGFKNNVKIFEQLNKFNYYANVNILCNISFYLMLNCFVIPFVISSAIFKASLKIPSKVVTLWLNCSVKISVASLIVISK